MKQVPVLGHHQENQPIDEAQKLIEPFGQVDLAGFQPGGEIGVGFEKTGAEHLERGFDLGRQPVADRLAFARAGLAPAFERAVGYRGAGDAEPGPMDQRPENGERGRVLICEDLGKVGFDVRRPGQRGIVAHKADHGPVRHQAPQRVVAVVEIVLKRESRGARTVGRERRAAPIELFVGRRHDDDRNAAAGKERDNSVGWGQIVETKSFLEEVTHEATSCFDGGVFKLCEPVEMGLADAEGSRDLLADRQSLADPVVFLRLLGGLSAVDARDHRRCDEVALERE